MQALPVIALTDVQDLPGRLKFPYLGPPPGQIASMRWPVEGVRQPVEDGSVPIVRIRRNRDDSTTLVQTQIGGSLHCTDDIADTARPKTAP